MPKMIKDDHQQEILAAIGAWTMHNAQGNRQLADEIFNCLIPKYLGRYPYHKLLAHLCQEAREPLLVTEASGPAVLTVLVVADRLSVKLPTGEVLFDYDAGTLADMLYARGFRSGDIVCADSQEGTRAPTAEQAVALESRLRDLAADAS